MIELSRDRASKPRATIIACVALVCGGALLAAPPASQSSTQRTGELPFLLDLPGGLVSVRYTLGALDRAVHAQRRYEPLVKDFGDWSQNPIGIAIVLLSRDEWEAAGLRDTYGLPSRLGQRHLALPARGDPGTVELWRRLLGQPLPALQGTPIRGTAEEAASLLLSDLVGEIEAARLLLEAGGYSGEEPWVGLVMAHAVARSALLRNEPGRLTDAERLFALLARSGDGSHQSPLDEYSALSDLEERLGFEARFFAAVPVLAGPDDWRVAKKLLKRARSRGGTVTVADLARWYPGITDWLERSFER